MPGAFAHLTLANLSTGDNNLEEASLNTDIILQSKFLCLVNKFTSSKKYYL